MGKNVNNNSVIIECERVDLTPYLGNLSDDEYMISWKSLGYLISKPNDPNKKAYSVLPKGKKYAVRFPKERFYTNTDGREFVDTMLCRSNFAKADKILGVLYRQENKPCGVLTEEF